MNTHLVKRKAYSVSTDSYGYEVIDIFTRLNEPYVFIKDNHDKWIGYFSKRDFLSYLDDKDWDQSKVETLPYKKHLAVIHDGDNINNLFTYFSEEVVIISNENKYLLREDVLFYFLTNQSDSPVWTRSLLNSIGMGIILVDKNGKVINSNETALQMINISLEDLNEVNIGSILGKDVFDKVIQQRETVLNKVVVTDNASVVVDFGPIEDKKGQVTGAMIVVQNLPYVESMATEFEYVKNLNQDLQAILSTIYDEILVVDSNGVLLRYSGNLIKDFWKNDKENLIGVNLIKLDYEGIFFSQIVKMILEEQKKISVTQNTPSGKSVLVVGNPIFNVDGKLERIILALRDITETEMLREELQYAKEISLRYKKELELLQHKSNKKTSQALIYCSKKIEDVMESIQKVSEVSSTVLLTGESGVGKEVFARSIYELGIRRDYPFVKINCGAIPENLLESELFGYVKGAFTGANTEGKEGLFLAANRGILFLDEVSELPIHLQVKLLRALQEREITPIGGTEPIEIDVQIVAATNKNLEKLVEEGKFREDLYYRLNVIPIQIPSLRERPEDIPLLSAHFLQMHNEAYDKNKQLTQDAYDVLESYSWPGNVRQLQNIIERIVVMTDGDLISSNQITPFLQKKLKHAKSVTEKEHEAIVPLKEAVSAVEKKLIIAAMDRYKTTVRAAKVLGVSQTTISRKYQEIMEEEAKNK